MDDNDDASFRLAMGSMTTDEYRTESRRRELEHWRRSNRRCGRCGAGMEPHPDPAETAFKCPACGHTVYPQIAPAVIALVERDGRILLQRNTHYPLAVWSLVAGFVDAGEGLEDAVRREIREEASIEVKNIRYFGSQPWPFPSNLMIGFLAEYESGELRPDGSEVVESGWFAPDALPALPPPGSIARRMIDSFVSGQTTD